MPEFSRDLCEQKHKEIDGKIQHHESWLGEHEKKIDGLTTSDARNTTQIDNLIKAIGGQTKAIWGLVSSVLLMLFGFFVWYIQNIGK